MAVQAQHLAHAFRHDRRAIRLLAPDNATSASAFLGEPAGGGRNLLLAQQQARGNTVLSDPHSELTGSNNNNNNINNDSGCVMPRKRARVGDVVGAGSIMDLALLPPPVPVPQSFAAAGDVQSREHGSGAASTSGRPASAAPASQALLSQLYRHGVEIDALVRIENERLRAGLEEARHQHVRALVSAMERAAARRLRAVEADLERAMARSAELDEKLRQMAAEGQAWQSIANSHEATAAGLRATLDQLLQSPCAGAEGEGEADDAESCCFEQEERAADRGEPCGVGACKACGGADACVLLLPCRHLCLCGGCEAAVDACPVCAATKNASLHVLLS